MVDESGMAMDSQYLESVARYLRQQGIELGTGLTDAEVDGIERRCAFQFPPDLRAFLQHVYPLGRPPGRSGEIIVGGPFPDWRNAPDDYPQQRFEAILEGIFFDIEKNGFWHPKWGSKPANFEDACGVARQELANAPALIPIFSHRFMPNEPLLAGNPVFSVHQTDIIYYGYDLAHYFQHEFHVPLPQWAAALPRTIRVWSESLNWRDNEFQPFRGE
jgi:hypothetical protein